MSCHQYENMHSRREFLEKTGLGLGAGALAHLLGGQAQGLRRGERRLFGCAEVHHPVIRTDVFGGDEARANQVLDQSRRGIRKVSDGCRGEDKHSPKLAPQPKRGRQTSIREC